jgi:beta-glucanase (GH16 family)
MNNRHRHTVLAQGCFILLVLTFSLQAGWVVTFQDDFNGSALDTTKWHPTGWVDNDYELQSYRTQNVEVSAGTLKLWMKKESYNGKSYTSGKITTGGQNASDIIFAQRFGRFECSMKVPKGKAMWPAFWLLPAGPYSWPPEIDIVEEWGFSNTAGPTTVKSGVWCAENQDCSGNSASKAEVTINPSVDPSAGFHVYAMEWDSTRFTFYYDNQTIGTTTQYLSQYKRNMWVLLQLALCGQSWGGGPPDAGTVFPACLEVDYVKVSKWSATTQTAAKTNRIISERYQGPVSIFNLQGKCVERAEERAGSHERRTRNPGIYIAVPADRNAPAILLDR